MKLTTKILIFLGATVIVASLGFICYKIHEVSNRQIAIESQVVKQIQLIDGIVRSQNEYATRKDVEKFISDNGLNFNAIQSDLNKLHAEVSSVNSLTAHSSGLLATNVASTSSGTHNPNAPVVGTVVCDGKEISCPNMDKYGYLSTQQNLTLNEPFANNVQVPVGSVGFSAWQEKPWNIDIKPREYHVVNVVGTDENQRNYFYSKFSVKVDGKDYDITVDQAETKQVYPDSKFSFWNPRLYLGAAAGVNLGDMRPDANVNLQLTIMSLGRYRSQPDFTFLGLGAAYQFNEKVPAFIISPFSYNIGKHLPLMNNVYLGPSLVLDTNRNFSVMAGITVGL